jgi:Fe2+ transport system protein FeoA
MSPESTDKNIISLAKARQGYEYKVVRISGGCDVQVRLASLGILPGQSLRVMQPGSFGPVMIAIKGSKLALGHGVSLKVLVQQDGQRKEWKPRALHQP